MKKAFLNKVHDMLLSEKENILAKHKNPVDIDIEGDEVDNIQGQIIARIYNQISMRDQMKLKGIEVALNKISDGTFGYCEECGEKIAEKRLMINPLFSNCIICAETLELEEKRNRRA